MYSFRESSNEVLFCHEPWINGTETKRCGLSDGGTAPQGQGYDNRSILLSHPNDSLTSSYIEVRSPNPSLVTIVAATTVVRYSNGSATVPPAHGP
jgi:hypothetical protein